MLRKPFLLVCQNGLFFDVNIISGDIFFRQLNEIADFPFQANIRHQTLVAFHIDARHVSRIRVSVRICVQYVENKHKINFVHDLTQVVCYCSSVCMDSFFLQKSFI